MGVHAKKISNIASDEDVPQTFHRQTSSRRHSVRQNLSSRRHAERVHKSNSQRKLITSDDDSDQTAEIQKQCEQVSPFVMKMSTFCVKRSLFKDLLLYVILGYALYRIANMKLDYLVFFLILGAVLLFVILNYLLFARLESFMDTLKAKEELEVKKLQKELDDTDDEDNMSQYSWTSCSDSSSEEEDVEPKEKKDE